MHVSMYAGPPSVRRLARIAFIAAALAGPSSPARAQERSIVLADSDVPRTPRFLFVAARHAEPIGLDMSSVPLLRRRVALNLHGATIKQALEAIRAQSGLVIWYRDDLLPKDARVDVSADAITAAAALTEVLIDSQLDLVFARDGTASLVKRKVVLSARILAGAIVGVVTDSTSGVGVTGVNVTVQGTRLGASTNEQGRYRIAGVPAGPATVVARRIGYGMRSQSVTVTDGGDATADFVLRPATTELEQVVVTATGEQKKLEIGNTIGSLQVDSVVNVAPITNVVDLLQGRVSGVMTFANSGITGSASRIRIRGFNSLSQSNAPIMIIDGVRVENSTGGSNNFGASGGYGWSPGSVTELNPDEIESFDIVKGPSAATLYGTDAANGVIVIKTKRGQAGQTNWNVFGSGGVIDAPKKWNDTFYAFGHTPQGAQVRCTNVARTSGTCALDSLSKWNPMEQSAASPLGTGWRQQAGVNASGGVQQFRYFVAGEYEDETGWLEMSDPEIKRIQALRGGQSIPDDQIHPNYLHRVSLRSNFATSLGKKAELSLNTSLGLQKTQLPGDGIFWAAAWGPGFKDAGDGWLFGARPGEYFGIRSSNDLNRLTSALSGHFEPTSWLSTRATIGIDHSDDFGDNLQKRGEGPQSTLFGNFSTGRRLNIRTGITLYTGDVGASAHYDISPQLSTRTSVGAQYNRRNLGMVSAEGIDLPPGSSTIAGAATVLNNESTVQSVVAGAYAEEVLGWREKLFLTGALRADGASSFGANFKTAVYPKGSLSWVIADPAKTPLGIINSLRYRIAYGASGIQPSAVAALPRIRYSTVFVNGASVTGAQVVQLGNRNLKPENVRELETGIDAEFWSGRLKAEATYYERKSTDALVLRGFPASLGIAQVAVGTNTVGTGQLDNVGSVRNRGLEGSFKAQVIDTKSLGFDLDINASTNKSKLLKLDPTLRPPEDRFIKFVQGYPLFGQWDRKVKSYKDANGDGILQPNEVVVGDSIEFLGNTNPTRMVNVTPTLTLFAGKLRFSSLFVYKGGYLQTNFSELNKCAFGSCRAVNDPHAPLKQQAAAQAFFGPSLTYEGYEEDGSFVRWAEASISYIVDKRFVRSVRAKSATITLSARNLHLWTKYTGLDPEVSENPDLAGNFGTVWDLGYDNPVAPQARYFILRVTLGY